MSHGIHILQTGGTIDKDYPKAVGGYAFDMTEGAVRRVLSRVHLSVPVSITAVFAKDSQDINAQDRQDLAKACNNVIESRIIITHGTDTMIDTARYLHEHVTSSEKIIVLTGAQKPETFKDSDADFNIGLAFGAIQGGQSPGIYIAMNGCVLLYKNVTRNLDNGKFQCLEN